MEEEICAGRVRKHCGYSKDAHNSCKFPKRRALGLQSFLIHGDTSKWYFCQIFVYLFSITCNQAHDQACTDRGPPLLLTPRTKVKMTKITAEGSHNHIASL
jgi:hypothetical protein